MNSFPRFKSYSHPNFRSRKAFSLLEVLISSVILLVGISVILLLLRQATHRAERTKAKLHMTLQVSRESVLDRTGFKERHNCKVNKEVFQSFEKTTLICDVRGQKLKVSKIRPLLQEVWIP